MSFTLMNKAAALVAGGLVMTAAAGHAPAAHVTPVRLAQCVVTPKVMGSCGAGADELGRARHARYDGVGRDWHDRDGGGRDWDHGDTHGQDYGDHGEGRDDRDHGDRDEGRDDHNRGDDDHNRGPDRLCDPADNFVGRHIIYRVGHCDVDAEWGGREPMHPFGDGALGGARR